MVRPIYWFVPFSIIQPLGWIGHFLLYNIVIILAFSNLLCAKMESRWKVSQMEKTNLEAKGKGSLPWLAAKLNQMVLAS